MPNRTEREDYHLTLNVYGPERVETVRNALKAAERREDAESTGESVAALAKAYTGWSATERDREGST